VDDDDAKHILLNIRRMVSECYPFKDTDTIDPRYAMAFGLIVGICTEALQAKQQNRPMRIETALRTPGKGHEN
jgi:hypothetical protein